MFRTIIILAVFVGGFFALRPAPYDWTLRKDTREWVCADVPPATGNLPQILVERRICFAVPD